MKQFDFSENKLDLALAASGFWARLASWPVVRVLVLCLVLGLGAAAPAQATHFRYGTLTWRTVASDPSKRTVEFRVSQAWRRSFGATSLTVGSSVVTSQLDFGDGTNTAINLTVTSVDVAGDSFYGESIITHTYAAAGDYRANYTDCCRLSTLSNNANGVWYVNTLVNAGSGNNSPVSTLVPVVNLALGQAAATFRLPASDPDGDALTFSLATPADFNGNPFANAPGMTVDATTGAVSFSTAGYVVDQMFNAVIKVSDGRTSILVDFLVKVTGTSTAPVFDYSITPPNAYVYQVAPGQPVTFTVRATDSDANDVVNLQLYGAPLGATVAPVLPLNGNPVQTTFTWTPAVANLGTTVLNFVAQDLAGVQTSTSVTIEVSQRPRFDVPPTPANRSVVQVAPGTPLRYTIQASDPDATDRVTLMSVTGMPASAGFAPALPTATANPVSTQLNWTPALADWGPHDATFIARDTYNEQATHTLSFLINSAPSFTSQPTGLSLTVGQPFVYNISTTDPDLPYGDRLDVVASALPTWLQFVDNGNGTATLSGTPGTAQIGAHRVTLEAEDIYHHGNSYGRVMQSFMISVVAPPAPVCTLQLAATPTAVNCNGQRNGSIALTVSGATTPATFAWTGPNGYTSTAQSPTGLAAGTYTVTAQSATCTVSRQVIVTEPAAQMPQISCGSNIVVSSPAGSCGAVVTYPVPVGSHVCRTVTTTRSAGLASGSVFPVGTTTVTYVVVDNAQNKVECSFTVRVKDVTPPVVRTRPVSVTLVNGVATVAATQMNNGSTDACGIASITLSQSTFTCANLGPNNVTMTVTDVHGNSASAPAVVTVTGGAASLVSITVTRSNNVYTGGPNNTIYLGYGAQTAQLKASGGTTYRWSPAAGLSNAAIANPIFAPKTAGTYTYTVTSTTPTGCYGKASVTLKVVDVRCGKEGDHDDDDDGGCDHDGDHDGHGDDVQGHDGKQIAPSAALSFAKQDHDEDHDDDDNDHSTKYKVLVCHNGHAICISANAVPAHLLNSKHHDNLGNCTGVIGTTGHGDEDDEDHDGDEHGHHDRSLSAEVVLEAYPNPFTTETTVHFRAPETSAATVRVYNMLGVPVATLFEGLAEEGRDYSLTLHAEQLPTGLYLCRFLSKGHTQTQQLMVGK
ncbi:MAG: hypothetical protein JWR44_3110 [Hymenobacter sp.]|nr:hypothetical protein [Hymenobacter sp.]